MHKLKATILRFGLETGLADKCEIISWADQMLESDEPYTDWMGDLATCHDRPVSEIYGVLGSVPGQVDYDQLWSGLRDFIRERLSSSSIDPHVIISHVLTNYRNGFLPKDAEDKLIGFELDYGTAAEGYVTKDEIDEEVRQYFKTY